MSTINRENYESWLMLYLDNELTASERQAVEAFAAAHPDVQDELNGLKETMLTPATPPVMPGSERLLMPIPWDEEALCRQQEQLLMLTDGVLSPDEKEQLEQEIAESPLLQKEWALLQNTVLPAETPAEMPQKEKLYRYQESTRVIPIGRILRYAAAAAILGFGWFFVADRQQTIQEDINQVAVTRPGEAPALQQITPDVDHSEVAAEETQQLIADVADDFVAQKNQPSGTGNVHSRTKGGKQQDIFQQAVMRAEKDPEMPAVDERDIAVQLPMVNQMVVSEGVLQDVPAITQPENVSITDIAVTLPVEKAIAAADIIGAEESDEDETISIAGARIPKQKIRNAYRNFTRPLARSFERNNVQRFDAK